MTEQESEQEVRRSLTLFLSKHQPAGWDYSRGVSSARLKCNCGERYLAGSMAAHQAARLASLFDQLVACRDCNGVGDDLCDACDGSGTRGRGKCRECTGTGTIDCPTCSGVGVVTRVDAESMGWLGGDER
jgi:hypothetical protein